MFFARSAIEPHALVVGAGLQNDNVRSGRHCALQTRQHAAGGVPGNARIGDRGVDALGPEQGLQPHRVGVGERPQPSVLLAPRATILTAVCAFASGTCSTLKATAAARSILGIGLTKDIMAPCSIRYRHLASKRGLRRMAGTTTNHGSFTSSSTYKPMPFLALARSCRPRSGR